MSQSELGITFSFIGTDKIMKGEILRLQSPLTVQALLDKAPFSCRTRGNIGNPKGYWIMLVEIERGPEKQIYKDIKVGDIVYCPRQDSLFIFFDKPYPVINDNVFFVGTVKEGLEHLKTMRNGVMCRIDVKDISKSQDGK